MFSIKELEKIKKCIEDANTDNKDLALIALAKKTEHIIEVLKENKS